MPHKEFKWNDYRTHGGAGSRAHSDCGSGGAGSRAHSDCGGGGGGGDDGGGGGGNRAIRVDSQQIGPHRVAGRQLYCERQLIIIRSVVEYVLENVLC